MAEDKAFILADTVDGMVSGEYRERFVAEFDQLTIRTKRLHDFILEMDGGNLDFEPACTREVLHGQLCAMHAYRDYLKIRAEAEGFEPDDFIAWTI